MVSDGLGAEIDVAHLQEIDHEKGGKWSSFATLWPQPHGFLARLLQRAARPVGRLMERPCTGRWFLR